MKKVLVILLVVVALPLYSYNAFLLIRMSFSDKKDAASHHENKQEYTFEELLQAATPVVFAENGRNPFTLHRKKVVPVKKVRKKIVKRNVPTKKVSSPPIVLSGVLWKPDNPIAMVKVNGSSTKLVKRGETVGGNIMVKKVEKKSIVVVYEGKEFVIRK